MSLDSRSFFTASSLVLISGISASTANFPEAPPASPITSTKSNVLTPEALELSSLVEGARGTKDENSLAQCHDCTADDVHPEKIPVPVIDHLSFAAVADPQFNKNINGQRVAIRNSRAGYTLDKVYNDESYRGLLVAGDLTEHTYKWEILQFYNSLIPEDEAESELHAILDHNKQLDRLYEGLGNHDMAQGNCYSDSGGRDNHVCETELLDIINRGERRDQIRSQPPHYSWEWDGIRFVQLNLEPVDEPKTGRNHAGRDPHDALQFLKSELADAGQDKNVIVVHHYGLDGFSVKWWSDDDRQAYEDAIKDYRVIAIVTGHLHWTRDASRLQQCWNGVTAVTVGAARLGFVLDFTIDDDQLTLTRSRNGEARWQDSYSIGQDNTTFCGSNT